MLSEAGCTEGRWGAPSRLSPAARAGGRSHASTEAPAQPSDSHGSSPARQGSTPLWGCGGRCSSYCSRCSICSENPPANVHAYTSQQHLGRRDAASLSAFTPRQIRCRSGKRSISLMTSRWWLCFRHLELRLPPTAPQPAVGFAEPRLQLARKYKKMMPQPPPVAISAYQASHMKSWANTSPSQLSQTLFSRWRCRTMRTN